MSTYARPAGSAPAPSGQAVESAFGLACEELPACGKCHTESLG
jgi:hypothetical protein